MILTGQNPITCHEGTDWSQGHSSHLSLTLALDGGGWLTPRPGHFTRGSDTVTTL
jgi:hypothetical protein